MNIPVMGRKTLSPGVDSFMIAYCAVSNTPMKARNRTERYRY